jgi:hypothetical protein
MALVSLDFAGADRTISFEVLVWNFLCNLIDVYSLQSVGQMFCMQFSSVSLCHLLKEYDRGAWRFQPLLSTEELFFFSIDAFFCRDKLELNEHYTCESL